MCQVKTDQAKTYDQWESIWANVKWGHFGAHHEKMCYHCYNRASETSAYAVGVRAYKTYAKVPIAYVVFSLRSKNLDPNEGRSQLNYYFWGVQSRTDETGVFTDFSNYIQSLNLHI